MNTCARSASRRASASKLNALNAIAVMVDRGLGVSLVPDWAPPWPEGLQLVRLPLPQESVPRRIGVIWSRATVRMRLVTVLLQESLAEAGVPQPRADHNQQKLCLNIPPAGSIPRPDFIDWPAQCLKRGRRHDNEITVRSHELPSCWAQRSVGVYAQHVSAQEPTSRTARRTAGKKRSSSPARVPRRPSTRFPAPSPWSRLRKCSARSGSPRMPPRCSRAPCRATPNPRRR